MQRASKNGPSEAVHSPLALINTRILESGHALCEVLTRYTISSTERRCLPAFQCNVCYEYDATWHSLKMVSGNKDPTEFSRLYDRLGELREKIDLLQKEASRTSPRQ